MESKDERDARRAAALRANLRRRKEQARGVKDQAAAGEAGTAEEDSGGATR